MTPHLRDMIQHLPHEPGVYRFRNDRGAILYIGRATDLRARVASYWSELRDRRHLRRMVPKIARIEAAACDSVHEAAWLERNLLQRRLPRWNRTVGGEEAPVCVRMDTRPASPGLRVTRSTTEQTTGVRYFGPYLGGLRVRLAVAALDRLYSFAYTASRLTGAERDMARKRGVDSTQRTALVGTLTAILVRDVTAVDRARAALVELRDQAAGALAFEVAAQVQSELQALEWITCTQRASQLESVDLDIAGWSGGVLVRFGVRAGQLCEWSQRTCTAARGAAEVSATPEHWRAFAQRNADLAAALHR
jgi:excinuclease ABC subunit C